MTTHGRILVRQADDHKQEINVYAWHDGHFEEAVELLVNLPKTIFDFAKESHFAWALEGKKVHGPWFYDVSVRHSDKHDTKDYLIQDWRNFLGLEMHATSVSNWITFVNFNHWTVVPSVEWCTYYEDYHIIVDVDNHGYKLSFPHWEDHCCDDEEDEDDEDDEDDGPDLKSIVDGANELISDSDCYIQLNDKEIYVPFSKIVVNFLWEDLQKINAIKAGQKVDPRLELLVSKTKNVYKIYNNETGMVEDLILEDQ